MSQPAGFNRTTLIVDDTSSLITYSAGWTQGFSGANNPDPDQTDEYMKTKHDTSTAGATAKFNFTGTSVAVYGSLGSFDVYGVPVSSYTVDGGDSATYTAPIVPPPQFQTHVLFYQSPPLSAGTHELVITNINGTAPSLFTIDYILYDPSETTGETDGGGDSINGTNGSLTSLPLSTSFSSSSASTTGTSAADTTVPSPGSTSKHTSSGAIAGGVIGGLAALALLTALLFLCFRKRKHERIDMLESGSEPDTTSAPFQYKEPEQNFAISPFSDPEERSRVNVLSIKQISPMAAASIAPPASSSSSTPQANLSRSSSEPPQISSPPSPSPSPIVRHTDSGIRIPAPVEIPPEYTQD